MQNEQIFNSVYTGEEMDNAFSVALAIANHNGIPKGTGKGSIQILGMDTNSLTSDGERIPTSAAVAKAIAEARTVSELLTFKGVVQTIADLPADAAPGFVYIVEQEDNENYLWDGVIWTPIGKLIAPIVLSSQSVSYQISDSGDTVPSGEWLIEFPAVQQGKYIWTRTVVQFSVGDPITSYSCAYIGVDGSGAVATVCGVEPDDNANINLTAENVGARPNTWTPTASDVGALPTDGGDMTGPINMNGQTISGLNAPTEDTQAANKAYVDENVNQIRDDLATKEPLHKILSATLVTGETTLTFTDDAITDNALIYIYTNVWGVQPSAVEQSGNTLTLTFDAQSADLGVKVEVR